MTSLNEIEYSEFRNRPVELYHFQKGAMHWRYISSEREMVHDFQTYTPLAIQREDQRSAADAMKTAMVLEMDPSAPVLHQYIKTVPYEKVTLRIIRLIPSENLARVIWRGRINHVQFRGLKPAEVECATKYSSVQRTTIRRCWQKPCGSPLYSMGFGLCNLNPEDFGIQTTIVGVSGFQLTIARDDLAENYLAGGFFLIDDDGQLTRRYIRTQKGAVLDLDVPLYGNYTGHALDVYPGCDHTLKTCTEKFGNWLNYGGQPWIPEKNPMNGSLVF